MAHFRRNKKGILRGFGKVGQKRSGSGGLLISDNKNKLEYGNKRLRGCASSCMFVVCCAGAHVIMR